MILLSKSELIDMKLGVEKMFNIPMVKKQIKFKIPKMKAKLNPTELRVSGKACVRLNNLLFINKNIAKLTSQLQCATTKTNDESITPICLQFTELLDFAIIKPFSLKIYLRLTSTLNGRIRENRIFLSEKEFSIIRRNHCILFNNLREYEST